MIIKFTSCGLVPKRISEHIEGLPHGREWECEIRKPKRTNKQNAAMWLYITMVCQKLNDIGHAHVYRHPITGREEHVKWSKEVFMDIVWRKAQVAMTGKVSTTQLNTKEVSEIHEAVDGAMEIMIGKTPFPEMTIEEAEEILNS